MFVEFEPIYRLLDLPGEADADSVRKTFAERLAGLETQKESAGSKPERMIAARAIAELNAQGADAERLASALEAKALLAEVHSALAESKAARASRALKNARAAAEKSGLRALTEAVAEAEDSLADSGLVRDPAFDAEIEELVGKLATLEATSAASATGAGAFPSDFLATLGALEGRRAALSARLGGRKDEETRGLLEGMPARFAALRVAHDDEQKRRAVGQAIDSLKTARQDLAARAPIERLEHIDVETLRATLAGLEKLLAEPVPPAVQDDDAFAAERATVESHAAAIRAILPRREALAALESLEADLAANKLSAGHATRVGEVEKRCQEAGIEDAPARLAALREQIARRAQPPPLKPPPAVPPPMPEAPKETPKETPAAPVPVANDDGDDEPLDATIPFIPKIVAPEPAAATRFTLIGPKGERCHVVSTDPVVFGRSSASDVVIRAFHPSNSREADRVTRAVSRAHFTVARAGENIEVLDGARQPDGAVQRSINGTFDGEGAEIESAILTGEGASRVRVTRETDPAIPPAWEIRMQKRATLGTAIGELRDANPEGPDCALLRRVDGSKENILLLWRATNLRELGLSADESVIVRHKGGYLLWEAGRLMEIETGFRIAGRWQVAKMGELTYAD